MMTENIQKGLSLFQLTAARRRLVQKKNITGNNQSCFNSQPPEGGWW